MESRLPSKPIIGILANILTVDGGMFPGQERSYVNHEYVTSILKAEGVPVLLPIISDVEAMARQIDCVDGVLLSGGYDIHPQFYGEEPHPRLESIYPERDAYELDVLRLAHQQGKPILGICRGLQLMNVAFGGTLYQDISHLQTESSIQHNQKSQMHVAGHSIELMEGTRLHQIFKQKWIVTNSFHHQAIKQLAPGFAVSAKAKDGIIEGIEKQGPSFMLGVQWHPEMMVAKHSNMVQLFEYFVQEARVYRSHLNDNT